MKFSDLQKRYGITTDENDSNENDSNKKKTKFSDLERHHGISYDVNQDYINSFISEADNFLKSAEYEYNKVGWGNASDYYKSRNTKWQDLDAKESYIRGWLYSNKGKLDEETYNSISSALDGYKSSFSSTLKAFEDANNFYSQFASEEEYNTWYEADKKSKEFKSVLDSEDFDEYSKLGANASNPSWKKAHAPVEIFGWTPFGDGETINNMVTFAVANKENAFRASVGAMNSGSSYSEYADLVYLINQYMTDEEKGIYNYYVGKGDAKKANEYLTFVTEDLKRRQAGKIVENVGDSKVQAMSLAFAAGLDQFGSGIRNLDNYFTGAEADPTTVTQYASSEIRNNLDGFWGGAYDVVNTTSNMLPSILVGSLTSGIGGTITMSASAVGNSYAEMRNLGYKDWQAAGYASLVGASEGLLQAALGGISKLGGKYSLNKGITKLVSGLDNAFARLAIQLPLNMASEGLEESIQTVLEPAFKALMTGEDYEAPEWEEILYSGLLGALSAGLIEGGPATIGTVGSAINANKIKNVYGGDVENILTDAASIKDAGKSVDKYINKYEKKGELSGWNISNLIDMTDTNKVKSAVEAKLTSLGEKGDVSQLADILTKQAKGIELSKKEQKILDSSTYGERMTNSLDPEKIKSGEYETDWVKNIGTRALNTSVYNKSAYDIVKEAVLEAENTPQKEISTEGNFEAPVDAKITIEREGEKVEVKPNKIASIENGEMSIELEGGETVNVDEVDFGESGIGLVYQAAQDMSSRVGGFNVDTANVFVRGYTPGTQQSAAEYIHGWTAAFKLGAKNSPRSLLDSYEFTSKLTQEQRETAYNFGKAFGNEKVATKEKGEGFVGEYTKRSYNTEQAELLSALPVEALQNAMDSNGAVSFNAIGLGGDTATQQKWINAGLTYTEDGKTYVDENAVLDERDRRRNASKQEKIVNTVSNNPENISKTDSKKKKGRVHFDGRVYGKSLNERQRASLKTLRFLADALGIDIYVFEASTNAKGKRIGENGWYDTSDHSIHIDLYAGAEAEALMIWTASHELTHHIREVVPEKFNILADAIFEEYTKRYGDHVMADLIEKKTGFLKEKGRITEDMSAEEAYDLAYEEVIADCCETMLTDSNAIEALSKNIYAKDKGLWEKIKEFFAKLVARIKAAYKDVNPDSYEGLYFRGLGSAAERIKNLWVDALIETTEVSDTNKVVENDLSNKDVLFNLRATKKHKVQLEEQYSKDASISLNSLMQRYNKIISIWERLGGELNSKFLNEWDNKVGKDRAFTVFKAQAGYKYNVELSSMCKKGVPLFEAIDTIVKKEVMKELDTEVLGKEEKEILYDILKEHNFEIPCAICYVEQARQREGVIIDAFLNGKVEKNKKGEITTFKLGWNEVLKSVEKEMKANGVDYTFKAVDRNISTEKYTPADLTMDEATQEAFYNALKKIANKEINRYNKAEKKSRKLVTSVTPSAIKEVFKGTLPSNLKIFKVLFTDPSSRFTLENDLLYSSMTTHNLAMSHNDLYSLFNSQGGVSGYKTKQGTVVYWGDILGKTWTPSKVRDEGGIRNQSNSDFQMYTLLDQAQMYIDFTAKGYYLQAYTKVLSELKLFGLSRGKINASLIPAVHEYRNADGTIDVETTRENAGLDENGNLLFDDFEGINHNEAFMLLEDAEYSKSLGGICIGYSDNHILKLLDDNRVQQIIGFHDKTDDPDKRYRGARYAKNYNGLNEAVNTKDGKTVHIGFNPYVKKAEKKFTFNAETETYEGTVVYNGKTYVADDIPRLAADLYLEMCESKGYTPAYADFAYHENYYKLLADFSLYDSQGHYAPHRKVAYNMPDSVPYLDANGNKKYMATKDYIKAELVKELKVRDSICEAMADDSENGIIPQFKKRVNEAHKRKNSDRASSKSPYDGKVLYADSEVYDYSFMVSLDPMTVKTMPPLSTVKVDGRISQARTVELGLKNAASIGVKVADDQYAIKNAYTKRNIILGKGGLQHSLDASNVSRLRTNARLSAIGGYIVQNAVPVNGLTKENKQANGTYAMACLLNDGNGFVVAIVTVDEFSSRATNFDFVEITHSINGRFLAKKEDSRSSTRELELGDKSLSTTAISEISIADFLEIVNSSHQSILSNDVLKHFGETRNPDGHYAKRVLFSHRADKKASYAPTFYSHMGKVIDDIRIEKMGAGGVVSYLKGKGVKDEEIKWSGIEAFLEGKKSVTKAELQEFVAGSQLQIEEEMSGLNQEAYDELEALWRQHAGVSLSDTFSDDFDLPLTEDNMADVFDDMEREGYDVPPVEIQRRMLELAKEAGNEGRWSKYKLPGGKNYSELVFKMPNSSYSNRAMRGHWGQDAEGVLAHARIQDFEVDGKRMLFIEEIQSDWHNEGHSKGYSTKEYEDAVESHDKLYNEYKKLDLAFHKYVRSNEFMTDPEDVRKKKHDWLRGKVDTAQKKYLDAEKVVDSIKEKGAGDTPNAPFKDTYHEYVLKRLLRMAAEEGYDSIGWTTADIQSKRWSEDYAEGYRIEYDQDIPKFLRKYGKKWGATVEHTNLFPDAQKIEYTASINGESIDGVFDSIEEAVEAVVADYNEMWDTTYYADNIDTYERDDGGTIVVASDETGEEIGTIHIASEATDGTEVWSMDITDSMKESVLTEGQPLYQDRNPDSFSNRSLLANALETAAQNDIEREKLKQYKQKIDLINSEEQKLHEIREKIKELSFKKGPRDTQAIKNLQFEANQAANRINTYDRQLLNLESTKALKGVLEREKEQARKRAEQKGKEALARYREKAAETQRELLTRYQESRKRGIESRSKTAMKHKIKNVVSDLNKLLLNPTKDQHVPIGLQKVVADALDVINMDTMNAGERVAYYNDLISKSSNPDEIAMLTKKRDFFEYRDANFKERITALKNAYADFKESDDPLIRNAHNDAIEDLIKSTADEVGNKSLKDMSLEQLEKVYDMYRAILATVRNSNKMFKEGRQATVTENSESVKTEVREVGGHKDRVNKLTKGAKAFGWNLLKPIYALRAIGSNTLTKLYENVRAGEDTYAVDISEAREFFQDKSKEYNYDSWDFKKRYNFKDSTGTEFSLSLEQIMSLYAYSKREQADMHLEVGGFVFDDSIEVTEKKLGIPLKYEVNDANPYRLRKEDLIAITSSLSKDQRGFIDEMQSYLSEVMGAKGNEVSLAMYDIKLYNEKNYFPLKTSRYFREYNPEQSGNPMLRNSGFSKKTVPKAGNPIVLSNFIDVWTGHVNDMSMYHSFVLALEDFMRVYNYSSTAGGYDSVQQYIKNAYGAQANQYIEKLMQDINGGVVSGNIHNGMLKMFSKFKKATVAASLSTIVQQPTAVIRAMSEINPVYFVGVPFKDGHKKTWAEIKKYAPVAIIKEMGGFDVGSGRQAKDYIGSQKKGILGKIDDAFMWGATKADELGWNIIWKAVKREVASKQKLKPGTEEFYKACGKRFTEVVTQTQVYDSVFSRSGIMRDKGDLNKFATSFMGEPTTSLNMIFGAVLDAKRGGSKAKAVGKIASVYASIVGAAAMAALVYALRDDDEDESYLEKYAEALGNKLSSEVWMHNMVPYIRDIASIIEGWDVERPDMSIFADIKSSFDKLYKINEDGEFEWKVDFSDPKSVYSAIENFGGSIASAFGVPLKNILRDTRGIFNGIDDIFDDIKPSGVGDAFINGWTGEEKKKTDAIYEAILNGDNGRLEIYKKGYKTEDAYETAVRKALRDNDPRIKEAAQARYDGDISTYTRIAKEIIGEGNFSQDTVVAAINSEISAIKNSESTDTESNEDEDEATSIYKASDINDALESGDTALAKSIIDDLVKTKVANGKTEKEAKSSLRSSLTSYWKPLYKQAYNSGNASEMARIRKILYSSGLYGTADEVVKSTQAWLKD